MKVWRAKLVFIEPLLGTVAQRDVYSTFIASKAPKSENGAEEVATVDAQIEAGSTGFHKQNENPFIYDYQVKGFFKDANSMLRRDKGTLSSKITAYKKVIDGLLFIDPRRIPICVVGKMEILERPLRASTAQGERIALARSEAIPADSSIEFQIKLLGNEIDEDVLREWLDYGALRGLGQWRNGGYGAFNYTLATA